MGIVQKAGMYLLSLWLLFIILFIATVKIPVCFHCNIIEARLLPALAIHNAIPIICVFLFGFSFGFYLYFCNLIQGSTEGPERITETEDRGGDNMSFLATYVIPLLTFGTDSKRQMLILSVTLLFLGYIYVKTNLFYSSPTLAVLGFKITAVRTASGKSLILVSRVPIVLGSEVNVLKLDEQIYFARLAIRVKS